MYDAVSGAEGSAIDGIPSCSPAILRYVATQEVAGHEEKL